MSMLADRKVKQKYLLNPRNTTWSQDSNKFGQKLLEKMGWSQGQGLGPRGNGMVEHIKVTCKNDNTGMGYKETNDQWTEHDANFNALLQSLSGSAPPEPTLKLSSLEKKSQSSKVRVHYRKFTRGKDLSRCTEKDLANIFGKRSLEAPRVPEPIKEEKEESKPDGFYYNGGSMLDYFKKKLPIFGKSNGYVVGSNGVLTHESDEEEPRVGFGFDRKRKGEAEGAEGTPKKKKKEEAGLSNPGFDPLFSNIAVKKHVLNTIEEESEDVKEQSEEAEATEKKRRKGKEKSEDAEVQQSEETKKKRRKGREEIEEVKDEVQSEETKKRKKRKEENEDLNEIKVQQSEETKKCRKGKEESENSSENPSEITTKKKHKKKVDNFEIEQSKTNEDDVTHSGKKKKKKHAIVAMDNPNFDQNDDNCGPANDTYEVKRKNFDQNEDTGDTFEVKRKKKKNKSLSAIDNPSFDISDCQNSSVNDTFEVKRKKKKKNGIENPNFDTTDRQDSHPNNDFEVKRKKKSQDLAIDNPNFDISDCQNSYVDSNFEVKRKKKKKDSGAVDNPNFQNSPIEEPRLDLTLNVTNTPVAPKSSIKRRKSVRFSDVNEERIIPNEDVENRNDLFDINSRVIANGLKDSPTLDLDEISKKLDGCQAEVENDINEAKVTNSEVGNYDGTKLKFSLANFGRSPSFLKRKTTTAKSSYKHLIKGDVIVAFNNTNLHDVVGYGLKQ